MKMYKVTLEEYLNKIEAGETKNVIYYIDDINRIYIFREGHVKVVRTDI